MVQTSLAVAKVPDISLPVAGFGLKQPLRYKARILIEIFPGCESH